MSSSDGRSAEIASQRDRDELLRESEARFRRLADNASDIVFRYRRAPVPTLEYVNPAVFAITGYTPEEHYANPALGWAVVHPEDRPLLKARLGSPASIPKPLTVRLIRKDGGTIWAEHRMIPILDGGGEVVAVEGIVRDVTQHVLTQQTLERLVEDRTREIERRREVAESLRETLVVLNSDRSIAEILDHIVGQAIGLLRADAASLCQLDPSDNILRIRSARGLDPEYVARMEIPVGMAPVGEAILTRRPVANADIGEQLRAACDALPPHKRTLLAGLAARYRALMAVPLIVKGEAYGGLVVYYVESRQFSEEETALAMALGAQAALAIENARLRAHLQETAAAAERDRLARDLHDSVTQTLFSVNLIAGVLPRLWERNPAEARPRLEELRRLARGALAEMRTLLLELRPAALLEMPLADLLQQLAEATAGRSQLPVAVRAEGQGKLPPDVQIALYRIAQETLNNAAKHSAATQCTVTMRWDANSASLAIADNGRGFDPRVSETHLGLRIMRERAQTIGAALRVTSERGQGTAVELAWSAGAVTTT
jgi:PAS domain S-box-containing protein